MQPAPLSHDISSRLFSAFFHMQNGSDRIMTCGRTRFFGRKKVPGVRFSPHADGLKRTPERGMEQVRGLRRSGVGERLDHVVVQGGLDRKSVV